MATTLANDSNDFPVLFPNADNGKTSHSETLSPASTELSDDSSLTPDDVVLLSDLFGFTSTATATPKRPPPCARKRPRATKAESEDGAAPKSQQQRQKLEIAGLKQQVVELQATIEELQARKLDRERQELEKSARRQELNERTSECGISEQQVAAVQQLEQQNEKLRSQVTTHLGQLQQLEQLARTRYLASMFPEHKQLSSPDYSSLYSTSC
jgi:hypothetical protein